MPRPVVLSLEESADRLSAAEALLARWVGSAADQQREADVLAAELVEAQERAADDLLDVNEAEQESAAAARVAKQLADKQDAQALAVRAAQKAAGRLSGVRREVVRARAAAVRSRARQVEGVAATRQSRTDQMLAAIAEFEGVNYAPASHPSMLGIGGHGLTPTSLTQRLVARAQWLVMHASGLENLAEQGSDDQIVANVAAGMPPLDEAEQTITEPADAAA